MYSIEFPLLQKVQKEIRVTLFLGFFAFILRKLFCTAAKERKEANYLLLHISPFAAILALFGIPYLPLLQS